MRIIISVINDLSGDQRIHRIASSLQAAGHEVLVVGRQLPDSLPLPARPYRTHRLRLPVHRGKLFYLLFNLRLLLFLLREPADLLNANDLDTLLANTLAANLRRLRLVYDSHEYFTEVPELVHRPRTRAVWQWLERRLFRLPQAVYTVNGSIAHLYSEAYGRPVAVVRNLPFARPRPQQKPQPRLLIYQGALNLGRGLELMIDAMAHLPDYTLWLVGRGDLDAELRERVQKAGLQQRVIFQGFKPLEALFPLTCQASLGLSLEENLGKNYFYASPNKLYDYIQARVPVLVSALPEMEALVRQYGVGGVLAAEERQPETLARRIRQLVESPEPYADLVEACDQAARELCWEQEQTHLLRIYELVAQ